MGGEAEDGGGRRLYQPTLMGALDSEAIIDYLVNFYPVPSTCLPFCEARGPGT